MVMVWSSSWCWLTLCNAWDQLYSTRHSRSWSQNFSELSLTVEQSRTTRSRRSYYHAQKLDDTVIFHSDSSSSSCPFSKRLPKLSDFPSEPIVQKEEIEERERKRVSFSSIITKTMLWVKGETKGRRREEDSQNFSLILNHHDDDVDSRSIKSNFHHQAKLSSWVIITKRLRMYTQTIMHGDNYPGWHHGGGGRGCRRWENDRSRIPCNLPKTLFSQFLPPSSSSHSTSHHRREKLWERRHNSAGRAP